MRPGELLILISLSFSSLILLIPARNRPFFFIIFPYSLPLLFIFHIIAELPRWQMVPAYVLSGIVFIISLIQSRKRKKETKIFFHNKKKHPNLLLIFTTIVLLAAVILLPVFFPVFTLPPPTGPYNVGTVRETLSDTTRPETLTPDPDDYRQIVVKIWYPANTVISKKRDPYWSSPRLFSRYMAEHYHLPSFFFEHLGLVKTNSIPDADIAHGQERFPVVLTLHGGECINYITDVRVVSEELASHGFIVIGLTHPYSSLPVVFPEDGKAVCPPGRRKVMEQQTRLTETLMSTYFTQQDTGEAELLEKLFTIETVKIEEIARRIDDVQTVLRWLTNVDAGSVESIITGKCDRENTGVLGIHMGGSVAFNVFLRDNRLKACINLDGFHYTISKDVSVIKPYLLMTSEASRLHTFDFIRDQMDEQSCLCALKGTVPQSFTDVFLFSPLMGMIAPDKIPGYEQTTVMIRQFATVFFKTSLGGEDSAGLDNLFAAYKDMLLPVSACPVQ
jgi:predicted dienelactone hydrolase